MVLQAMDAQNVSSHLPIKLLRHGRPPIILLEASASRVPPLKLASEANEVGEELAWWVNDGTLPVGSSSELTTSEMPLFSGASRRGRVCT